MEAGKEKLTRDTLRDATQREIQELKRENGELKELVADLQWGAEYLLCRQVRLRGIADNRKE